MVACQEGVFAPCKARGAYQRRDKMDDGCDASSDDAFPQHRRHGRDKPGHDAARVPPHVPPSLSRLRLALIPGPVVTLVIANGLRYEMAKKTTPVEKAR